MFDYLFILQARVGSTRLPNKLLLPFYKGKNIFELLLDKLLFHFHETNVILATSTNSENDILEKIATSKNINTFRGSENDVLIRFINAAEYFYGKYIIRVCCDNPFLDINEIKRLLLFLTNNDCNYDYVSFCVNGNPCIKTHLGFWTEYVTLDALKKASRMTSERIYHEHVTNYLYENPDIFIIHFLEPNEKVNGRDDIRMTLDTNKDFDILSKIYKSLSYIYNDNFGIDEIIPFLDKNQDLISDMQEQIKNNTK